MKTLSITCIAQASAVLDVPEAKLLRLTLEEALNEGHSHIVFDKYGTLHRLLYALTPAEVNSFELKENESLINLNSFLGKSA